MIRRPPRSTLFPTRRSSDLLRYFVAVAGGLNFTKAAGELHLAQPSLTRQIHNLEDRKSTPLNSSHGYISYAVFFFKKKKTMFLQSPFLPTHTSLHDHTLNLL